MRLKKNCLGPFERATRSQLLFRDTPSPVDIHLLSQCFPSIFEKERVLCCVVLCSVCLYISGRTEKSTD